ncbi:MAG: hypothetical protein SGARI_002658 [Bacillariaceae sp.]
MSKYTSHSIEYSTPSKKGAGVHTVSHTQYLFPMLKSSELLQCLEELGFEFTKQELSEPQRHRDKIRKVFWHILDYNCGLTEEQLKAKIPQDMSGIVPENEMELHEDFIDLIFFKELRKMMMKCGVADFSWKDLYYPTPKRFRAQMSAAINLAKYREEQLPIYLELQEPRTSLLEDLGNLHKENEELGEHLGLVEAESTLKMEEFDRVSKQCQELESEIAKSNKLQASKREEASLLKKQVNKMKDELETAAWTLQELQAEEEALQGQVVSSPDRRKNELQVKKDCLEKEKEESRRLQLEITDGKAKTARLQQAIKDLQETMTLQRQVLDEASKCEEALDQVEQTSKEVNNNHTKTSEIADATDESERSLFRLEEKLSHTRKQSRMKMDAVQDRMEIAKEQLVIVEKERREGLARVEAGEAEVQSLKAQMKEEQEKTEQEVAVMIAEYQTLEQAFHKRNEKRMHVIEAAM